MGVGAGVGHVVVLCSRKSVEAQGDKVASQQELEQLVESLVDLLLRDRYLPDVALLQVISKLRNQFLLELGAVALATAYQYLLQDCHDMRVVVGLSR